MNKNQFTRRGEILFPFLSNYADIRRFVCSANGILGQHFDTLLRLHPYLYFTTNDMPTVHRKYLLKDGYIEKFYHRTRGPYSDHDKFRLTRKGRRLVDKTYKYILDPDNIPDGIIKKLKETKRNSKIKRAMRRIKKRQT